MMQATNQRCVPGLDGGPDFGLTGCNGKPPQHAWAPLRSNHKMHCKSWIHRAWSVWIGGWEGYCRGCVPALISMRQQQELVWSIGHACRLHNGSEAKAKIP